MKTIKWMNFCLLSIMLFLMLLTMTGCTPIALGEKTSDEDIIQAAMDNGLLDPSLKYVHAERAWESAMLSNRIQYIYIESDQYERYRSYWENESNTDTCDDKDPVFTYISIRPQKKNFLEKQHYSFSISKHAYYYAYFKESLQEWTKFHAIRLTEDEVWYDVYKKNGKLVFEKDN
jgi:hypothetical protein